MKNQHALGWVKRAEKRGFNAYLISTSFDAGIINYGVSIDGNGQNGNNFGCPQNLCSQEQCCDVFEDLRPYR